MRHRLFFAQIGESEDKSLLCGVNTGQYFDIKIDYVDITEEEFCQRMADFKKELTEQFAESHRLEEEIMRQIESLKFNEM